MDAETHTFVMFCLSFPPEQDITLNNIHKKRGQTLGLSLITINPERSDILRHLLEPVVC